MTASKRIAASLLTVVIAVGGLTTAAGAAPTPATSSSVGGRISRAEVIARAATWMDKGIGYSWVGSHPDLKDKRYRTDCSGFASMALHLPRSMDTVDLAKPSVTTRISTSELKPGDLVIAPYPGTAGHAIIFERWADAARTRYVGYEFGSTPVLHHEIKYPHGDDTRAFYNYRYRNIIDDSPAPAAAWTASVSVQPNADGRLEAFRVGEGNVPQHRWQSVPGGPFGDWAEFGGEMTGLVVGRNADGTLEAFGIGTDRAVHQRRQLTPSGPFGEWRRMGGSVVGLAIASNADGRLELVATGSDGTSSRRSQDRPNGDWVTDWESLGGQVRGQVDIGTNADGRLELFAIADHGGPVRNWQTTPNGPWSGWTRMGGTMRRITVSRHADGRLEVFAIGLNGTVFARRQDAPNGTFGTWKGIGGRMSDLVVNTAPDGRLELFGVDADRAVQHRTQLTPNGTWSGWESTPGTTATAEVNPDGRLEVLGIATVAAPAQPAPRIVPNSAMTPH